MSQARFNTLVVDARLIQASGIGTDLQNLLPLLKNKFDLTLIGDPDVLAKYPWTTDLSIITLKSPIYSVAEQVLLSAKIPSCDYFLSPHFNVPMLPTRAKKRVVIIHDVYHLASSSLPLGQKLYAKLLLQSAVSLSDKVITISEFSRSEIKKYLRTGDKHIYKIGLGIDHNSYRVSHDKALIQDVRRQYALPADFVLFVGNVKPHKNLRNLVLALSILKEKQLLAYKLVIVGKKEGFINGDETLLQLIDSLGLTDDILFTGYVANNHLPVIYSLAALFVFPSLYEGFGLPPLEAMASGCPSVVSKAASIPEICQDACCYFDGKNPDDIAATMQQVLTNNELRESLTLKGIALARNFNWESAADELETIIRTK